MRAVDENRNTLDTTNLRREDFDIAHDNIPKEEFKDVPFEARNWTPEDFEDVEVWLPINPMIRIMLLKDSLTNTDYKILKYMEGNLPKAEYDEVIALRQSWRDEINRLESELSNEG